jgi:hypothetical protein
MNIYAHEVTSVLKLHMDLAHSTQGPLKEERPGPIHLLLFKE